MRKICVVTGTRAEFGLLYWLMKGLQEDPEIELQVCVTGMHLSPEFGLTYQDVEKAGFHINEKVEMLLSSDTTVGITKSIGLGVIGMSEALNRLNPDLVLILGDRYEIFAVAVAALIARIPVAHCHGGETSEGVIDESIRHSITKMSHLHFTATEKYKRRVIQMGELPENVFNVGALGIENINRLQLLAKDEFEKSIAFKLREVNFLITFHPVTLENKTAEFQFKELLVALDQFPEAGLIFTKPNADTDGRIISKMLDEFVALNSRRAIAFQSLGQLRYISALQYVDVVIGNSSSGLIEVPSFKKPTINIGDRQKGRIKAKSIIDSSPASSAIVEAVNMGLSPEFRESIKCMENPYGHSNASAEIIDVLKTRPLHNILTKKFNDIESSLQ